MSYKRTGKIQIAGVLMKEPAVVDLLNEMTVLAIDNYGYDISTVWGEHPEFAYAKENQYPLYDCIFEHVYDDFTKADSPYTRKRYIVLA